MQDLLKINYETEEPTVSARELYDRLNIKSNFTTCPTVENRGC